MFVEVWRERARVIVRTQIPRKSVIFGAYPVVQEAKGSFKW